MMNACLNKTAKAVDADLAQTIGSYTQTQVLQQLAHAFAQVYKSIVLVLCPRVTWCDERGSYEQTHLLADAGCGECQAGGG